MTQLTKHYRKKFTKSIVSSFIIELYKKQITTTVRVLYLTVVKQLSAEHCPHNEVNVQNITS